MASIETISIPYKASVLGELHMQYMSPTGTQVLKQLSLNGHNKETLVKDFIRTNPIIYENESFQMNFFII